MIKVAIADDEIMIREGLKTSFKWEENGFKIIGVCKNGEEAYDLAKTEKPDIFLLDINMPILNGLDVIKKLNTATPNTRFIIITGFSEFEYAHQAIKLGVYDFILKPINESDLWSKIMTLKNDIITNKIDQDNNTYLSQQLIEHLDEMQRKFIHILVTKGYDSNERVQEKFVNLGLLYEDNVGLIVIKHKNSMGNHKKWSDQLLSFTYINMVKELAGEVGEIVMSQDINDRIFGLINIKDMSKWSELAKKVEECAVTILGNKVDVQSSIVDHDFLELPKLYKSLCDEVEKNYSDAVNSAKKLIEEEYHDSRLDLNSVANKLAITPSYLSKLFKKELGISFKEYLIKIRMDKAVELMKNSDMRFNEIALIIGYSNQHYFTRAFKKVTGKSPSVFKKDLSN